MRPVGALEARSVLGFRVDLVVEMPPVFGRFVGFGPRGPKRPISGSAAKSGEKVRRRAVMVMTFAGAKSGPKTGHFWGVEKGPNRPQTRAAIFGPRGKVLRRAADFRGGGGPQFGPHPDRISAAMKGLFCKKGQKLWKKRKNRGFIDPSIKRRTGTLRRRLSGKSQSCSPC